MSDNHDLHDEHISRLYKMGGNPEPSKHTDEQIKKAAHATASNNKRSYIWPSLATAAVLVLSINLVLKVLDQEPLEESIMEPMQSDDRAAQPKLMEKEAEEKTDALAPVMKDQDSGRLEELRLDKKASPERFRAKQRGAAPATNVKEAGIIGAAKLKPAPASVDRIESKRKRVLKRGVIINPAREAPDFEFQQQALEAPKATTGKIQSMVIEKMDCSDIEMPKTDSINEWQQHYKTALKDGHNKVAACLKQAFSTKFGHPILQEVK